MYYDFRCDKCNSTEEKQYSFAEFDKLKSGEIIDRCSNCNGKTSMVMGGVNVFIYDATPRTLGTLAERNSKFRIPQEMEKKEREIEKAKAEGKAVPKELTTWWDKPEKPKVDKRLRKEMRNEHVAKYNARKRSTHGNNNNTNKRKPT